MLRWHQLTIMGTAMEHLESVQLASLHIRGRSAILNDLRRQSTTTTLPFRIWRIPWMMQFQTPWKIITMQPFYAKLLTLVMYRYPPAKTCSDSTKHIRSRKIPKNLSRKYEK